MVVARVFRATGCASCRLSALWSFTAVVGLPPRTAQPNSRRAYQIAAPRAQFSTTANRDGKHNDSYELQKANINEEEKTEEALEVSGVPWYLQVENAQRPPQPFSDRQRIPDLPESPPPILKPLLEQISVDLGLNDVSLLDLRKLDPPPALGANLLMLIGTARSEKHLHVSADRLCRWLRSVYKLRPDADGLLGRNELKLKLRRKSRRAKLLGSASDDNNDDGVRTGWVCVDVGVVEGGEARPNATHERTSFVGFGRRTEGVRIVVQMLTEEKRGEIDLEKLWGGILKRGGQAEVESWNAYPTESPNTNTEHAAIKGSIRPLGDGHSIVVQSRGFHTSARYLSGELQVEVPMVASSSRDSSLSTSTAETVDFKDIQQSVILAIGSGSFDKAKVLLQHCKDVPKHQNEGWIAFFVEQLRRYLESTSKKRAIQDLGKGCYDHSSTPFLACFYQSLSAVAPESDGESRIWLYSHARELGHTGYTFSGLMELFAELQVAGVRISMESYLRLLRSALHPANIERAYHSPPRYYAEGAMKILQAMHDQGHNVLAEDVFVALQEATAPISLPNIAPSSIYTSSSDTFDLPSLPMSAIQRRIHVLIKSIDMPTFRVESRLRLLDLYSRQHHWLEFWDIWRLALRQGKYQSAPLYAFMFNRVAETNHQKACMNVLRTWIADMDREDPEVKLEGDVAEAVKACLEVADPYVAQDAGKGPESKGEWISLWRRCTKEHQL